MSRRYWEGLPTGGISRGGRRGRWSRLATLMVALGVAEGVVVAGVVTDGFGLAPLLSQPAPASSRSPNGPNPNPFNEKLDGLRTTIDYTGGAVGYFPGLANAQVCARCPMLPAVNSLRSPPEAVAAVVFNITNTGNAYHEITNFTLGVLNGTPSGVFELYGMYCCAATNFNEEVEFVGFTAGQTIEVEAYLFATEIPNANGAGYELSLSMVSSS